MPIVVYRASSPDDAAWRSVGEFDDELNADYPPEQPDGFDTDRVLQPDALFFVTTLNRAPTG